jgi:cyclopropane fatty-acyl-phospholipid synthase-like methyltransferase
MSEHGERSAAGAGASRPAAHGFVPALGLQWLTRFYDPLVRLTLREDALKGRLVDQASIRHGMAVLDLGCGTGTLAILIKGACPGAHVVGLDVDPDVLAIARDKITRAGFDVALHQGSAADPPLAPRSFDRVLTTLMLHHLTTDEKRATLAGVQRLLRPGGELHIADFGRPQNALMWVISQGIRWLDGSERTEVNLSGRLPDLVREAGFVAVAETGTAMTPFGSLAYLRATAPADREAA